MNGSTKLPPGWAPDTDVVAVVIEIRKRMYQLRMLETKAAEIENERVFLIELVSQLIETGHS